MALHLFDSVDRFGRKQRGAMTLLRERLGDPLPFEIEDTAILNAINAAIVEYSRLRPRKQEMTLQIKDGQESYVLGQSLVELQPVDGVEEPITEPEEPEVPNEGTGYSEDVNGEPETPDTTEDPGTEEPDDAYVPPIDVSPWIPKDEALPELFGCLIDGQTHVLDVVDCVFSFQGNSESTTADCCIEDAYQQGKSPFSYLPIDERHPYPSELLITTMYRDTLDRYSGHDWAYYPDNDVLSVVPAPSQTGVTKVVVNLMHSPSTIPQKDVELVLLYALADAMESLAHFRGKVKSLPTGVGFKMALDGGAELYKVAERKRKEFYSRFYTGGSHHTTG